MVVSSRSLRERVRGPKVEEIHDDHVSHWSRVADATEYAGGDQYCLCPDPTLREPGPFAAGCQRHAARFRPPDASSGSRQTLASAVWHLCEEHPTGGFW